MRGGPFIAYDASKTKDVKALMEKTIKEQAHILEFAAALQSLSEKLANQADGSSLEPLYESVPDSVKGDVELVYDLNNHLSIRFIEVLLYKSPYYSLFTEYLAISWRH